MHVATPRHTTPPKLLPCHMHTFCPTVASTSLCRQLLNLYSHLTSSLLSHSFHTVVLSAPRYDDNCSTRFSTSVKMSATTEDPKPVGATEQKIDPWNVQGGTDAEGNVQAIDYTKLTEQFGTQLIDKALLERFERVTGQRPHRFLRRGIVFSHRDLNTILDRYEQGKPFFLYTGRGPSSDSMHIGHSVPFTFTKWLSDVFNVPLVIMLTDDEKYLFKEDLEVEEVEKFSRENAKDIISLGFDVKKTFIFSNIAYMGQGSALWRNVVRMAKLTTTNQARNTFGHKGEDNIGRVFYSAVQSATGVASTFPHIFGEDKKVVDQIPCLIPCAIDQDPYFRLMRDSAKRLKMAKPSLIHTRFLDALQGPGSKMSASVDSSAIFLKDTPKQIKDKINKYAFSGGRETVEEHREKGGDPDVDVSYQYLRYFMEDDDELQKVYDSYKKGEMLTGELKKLCITHVQEYVKDFQDLRAKVTEETVDEYFAVRPLDCNGNSKAPFTLPIRAAVQEGAGDEKGAEEGKMSKADMKRAEKAKQVAAKKAAQKAEKEAAKAAAAAAAAAAEAS